MRKKFAAALFKIEKICYNVGYGIKEIYGGVYNGAVYGS